MKRIIFLAFALISQQCMADIYKWTDENGSVHYGDSPPGNKKAKKVDVRVNSYQHVTVKHMDFYKGQTKNKNVVMFGTSWCGYCKKAREYFHAHNINYTDYDIEKDSHAKQMYAQLGVSGVPVILVGNVEMQGFSASGFEKIYNHKN